MHDCLFCCSQGQLLSIWQDLSQSELNLNQQLSEFYDTLLSTWHGQIQWSSQVSGLQYQDRHLMGFTLLTLCSANFFFYLGFTQVFKKPYEVVTVLLIQSLGAMVPSIPVCLSTAMERAAQEERLGTLLELHHTTSTFGHNLEAAMLPHLGMHLNHMCKYCSWKMTT